jgi:hypothetical protein
MYKEFGKNIVKSSSEKHWIIFLLDITFHSCLSLVRRDFYFCCQSQKFKCSWVDYKRITSKQRVVVSYEAKSFHLQHFPILVDIFYKT